MDEVIRLVGKKAIDDTKDDSITVNAVPRPHPDFDEYSLVFSPEKGLLKVIALGRTIATNGFGEEVKDKFSMIREALTRTYGEPQAYDYLRSGSIWNEPRDWMAGLLKKERTLVCYWTKRTDLPNHITAIALEAKALSTEKGYLSLGYEFDGWEQYIDSKKSKASDVF